MFDRHQHRATPFTAERQTLNDPQEQQQHGRPNADDGVVRQQPDAERGDAHRQQRDQQHGFAAELVAEMPEHDCADNPRQIGRRKGAERQQRADERVEAGKEHLVEHEGRRSGEHEQIVPLHRGADDARGGDLAHAQRRAGVGLHRQCLLTNSGLGSGRQGAGPLMTERRRGEILDGGAD